MGGADISRYIQSQAPEKGENYRLTHTNDIVPQLPPHNWYPEWDHYFPEYWIHTETVPVVASAISVINGDLYVDGGNAVANSGWGPLFDLIEGIHAHSKYFGAISACTATAPGTITLQVPETSQLQRLYAGLPPSAGIKRDNAARSIRARV